MSGYLQSISGTISGLYNEVREEVKNTTSVSELMQEVKNAIKEDVVVFLQPTEVTSSELNLQEYANDSDSSTRKYTRPLPKERGSNRYFKSLRTQIEKQKSESSVYRQTSAQLESKDTSYKFEMNPHRSFDDLNSVNKCEDEIEAVYAELMQTGTRHLPILDTDERNMLPHHTSRFLPRPDPRDNITRCLTPDTPHGLRTSNCDSDIPPSSSSSSMLELTSDPYEPTESFVDMRSPALHSSEECIRAGRGPQSRHRGLSRTRLVKKKTSLSLHNSLVNEKGSVSRHALPVGDALKSDGRVGLDQRHSFGGKNAQKELMAAEKAAQEALQVDFKLMENTQNGVNSTSSKTAMMHGFIQALVSSTSSEEKKKRMSKIQNNVRGVPSVSKDAGAMEYVMLPDGGNSLVVKAIKEEVSDGSKFEPDIDDVVI
eukprot:CFRG2033T1